MDKPKSFVFIDEYGTVALNTENAGTTNLFIIVAVIVNEDHKSKLESLAQTIRDTHFSGSEIKSSGVGNNHKRRISILKMLSEAPFIYMGSIVNKVEIEKDSGIQYKQSAFKYLNNLLYQRIFDLGVNLHIIADNHGSNEFKDSFRRYIDKTDKSPLLSSYTHEFRDSKDENIIQVADIIAGTLAKIYDPDLQCSESEKFRELLESKQNGLKKFPFDRSNNSIVSVNSWDRTIEEISLRAVQNFEAQVGDSPSEIQQMKVAVLRRLVFLHHDSEFDGNKYSTNEELRYHLEKQQFNKLGEQPFTSNIIAPLRDAGILIAGTSHGYCLVTSIDDINAYLGHDSNVIEPMLSRLVKAQEKIKSETHGELDILNAPEFKTLQNIAKAFLEIQIEYPPEESTS